MLIQIESVEKDGPRKVRIEGEGEPIEFTADNLKDAHKRIAAARKDGWDTLRPAKKAAK